MKLPPKVHPPTVAGAWIEGPPDQPAGPVEDQAKFWKFCAPLSKVKTISTALAEAASPKAAAIVRRVLCRLIVCCFVRLRVSCYYPAES